jgi:hypothetical protein
MRNRDYRFHKRKLNSWPAEQIAYQEELLLSGTDNGCGKFCTIDIYHARAESVNHC